jgi:hypothetical protein
MPLWILLIIIFGTFIILGVVIDLIARKKKIEIAPTEGIKYTSESELIYKEQHLKQTIQNINDPTM